MAYLRLRCRRYFRSLLSRLAEIQRQKHAEEVESSAAEKLDIAWGSQIRSYVLHPYQMVKDHRTSEETGQPDKVLEGDLSPFIRAYLLKATSDTQAEETVD